MSDKSLFSLKHSGWLLYSRYFATKGTFTDFAIAAIRDAAGFQPLMQDYVRHFFKIDHEVSIRQLDPPIFTTFSRAGYEQNHSQLPLATHQEKYHMWNEAFFPWKRMRDNHLIIDQVGKMLLNVVA